MRRPAQRLVLDTNVVLDLLVFRDRDAEPIARALAQGSALCVTDAACAEELRRVLAYPQFALDADAALRVLEDYLALAQFHAENRMDAAPGRPPLPRCRDPHDQKFLELARDANADLLVTKDKALLTLARRKFRLDGFGIVAPAAAAAALGSGTPV